MARPYEGLYQGMKPAGLPAQLATRTAKSGGRYLWCGPPGSAPNRDSRTGQRIVASLLAKAPLSGTRPRGFDMHQGGVSGVVRYSAARENSGLPQARKTTNREQGVLDRTT